jgi:glutamate N-acetyltransferase/amino-acid N-acetyltransferase
MIVKDGEGATKFVEIKVVGAKTNNDAKQAAESIGNSLLTKCAIHGGDPNWGRVASSVGMSGISFDPDKMEIVLDGVKFFKNGKFLSPAKSKVSHVFKGKNVKIDVKLREGKGKATVYTCDLSKKYITINAFYTT